MVDEMKLLDLKKRRERIGGVGAIDFLINYHEKKLKRNGISFEKEPKVSVIIPTANRKESFDEALSSVLCQLDDEDEVVVVDNSNRDVAYAVEKASHNVEVIKVNPLCGVSVARNVGANASKNDWLIFLDDDDKWPKDYLKIVKRNIKTKGGEYYGFLTRKDRLKGGVLKEYKRPTAQGLEVSSLLYKNGGAGGSNLVVKKEAFFDVGGFDRRLHKREDRSFVLDLRINGYKLYPIVDVGVITRESSNDETRLSAPSPDDYIRDFMFFNKYLPYFDKKERMRQFGVIVNDMAARIGLDEKEKINFRIKTTGEGRSKSLVKASQKSINEIVYFCITFRPKVAATCWEETLTLLQNTLRSILAQTDDRYKVLVAGHDFPEIPEMKSDKVEFVACSYRPFLEKEKRRRDKQIKKKILASVVREKGGGYIMPVDADDIVSENLVKYILDNNDSSGWFLVSKGYVADMGRKLLFEYPRVGSRPFYETCGTCACLYVSEEDLPVVDKSGKPLKNSDCLYNKLTSHHTWYSTLVPLRGIPNEIPFPAVTYLFDHSDNISKDFVGLNERKREMMIKDFGEARPIQSVKGFRWEVDGFEMVEN